MTNDFICRYINQDVYNDIVEERSIVKNCGYPICLEPLPKHIKKQTYAINSRLNKVYKLEERNKFCSSLCYSASRNLRDQLSTEPVWLVPKNAHQNIRITPLGQDEEEDDEELPRNQKIDDKHLREDLGIKEPVFVREVVPDLPKDPLSHREVEPLQNVTETVQAQFSWLALDGEKDIDSDDDDEPGTNFPQLSFVDSVRHFLTQWRTAESSSYLTGTLPGVCEEDEEDFEEDLLDDDLRIGPLENKAPLPHIKELEDNSIQIKESGPPKEHEPTIHLPRIDCVNQVQQRKNIFVSKLQPSIKKLLSRINFSYGDVSPAVIKLVSYLNISSLNCMFTEKQSLVISAVILYVLFPLLNNLRTGLSDEQFLRVLLEGISDLVSGRETFLQLCDTFR